MNVIETNLSNFRGVSDDGPLFYRRPEPLSPAVHDGLRLLSREHYGFAGASHLVPLCADEGVGAAPSYPIVFVGRRRLPMALTGLQDGCNLFVERDGNWRRDHCVPLYLRRYPFLPGRGLDSNGRWPLSVDLACERVLSDKSVSGPGGLHDASLPFFVGGQPSPLVVLARMRCIRFKGLWKHTRRVVEAISRAGLFSPEERSFNDLIGASVRLHGFWAIDERAFDALSESAVANLNRVGALPLVYAHFASRGAWTLLKSLHDERMALDSDTSVKNGSPVESAGRPGRVSCFDERATIAGFRGLLGLLDR